ncbi:transporter substrate-binding domain-containing protein [Thalassovita mangrovi]|uniref:Transporter substrate-binding domain-containing protein n=1 Tax=Thalassovita mangrovi TaxID=2692236 RepID=A0A6L8LPJ5_9RHOB|nr:transporter substrate-binding domain-containing protein [Thalassovita mangrovi]MYM56510.1 transporter substrate-binding domain-containing protein [Thalassovita mangrovi]
MKHISVLAAAFSLAALPGLADTVTIGTVEAYDAGSYTIDPAALQGFEKALGDELCQRAGLTCEWKVLPSDRLWVALAAGGIDAVMAGVPISKDVGEGVDWTMPYLRPDPFVHIGLPGTQWQVEGAVVAHLPDPAVTAYAGASGATFTEYATIEDALTAVRDGQVLSLFGEREALTPAVEASGGGLVVVADKGEINIKQGVAMALRADDTDRRFAFEDQIFEMSKDGSLNALTETWFGVDAARW